MWLSDIMFLMRFNYIIQSGASSLHHTRGGISKKKKREEGTWEQKDTCTKGNFPEQAPDYIYFGPQNPYSSSPNPPFFFYTTVNYKRSGENTKIRWSRTADNFEDII